MKHNMYKRVLAVMLSLLLVIGVFAACGKGGTSDDGKDKTAPVIIASDASFELGSTVTLASLVSSVTDDTDAADDITITYAVTFNGSAVAVSGGKFRPLQSGNYTVTITAKDKAGNSSNKNITVNITPDSTAPVITFKLNEVQGSVGVAYNITFNIKSVTDNLDEVLMESQFTYWVKKDNGAVSQLPSGSFTPDSEGVYTVTVKATDSSRNVGENSFTVVVLLQNQAPQMIVKIRDEFKVADKEWDYEFNVPMYSRVTTLEKSALNEYTSGFVADISDDSDALTVVDLAFSVKNSSDVNIAVLNQSYGDASLNFFITKPVDVYYLVTVTATDSEGASSSVVAKLNVDGSAYSAASLELLGIFDLADYGTYINTTTGFTEQCTYSTELVNTDTGYGRSIKLSSIGTAAKLGIGSFGVDVVKNPGATHSASNAAQQWYNGKNFDSISLWVYIGGTGLTASQLQELTPKPSAAGWTCTGYPTEANKWVKVTYTFAAGYAHDVWILLDFSNTGTADTVVYVDGITFNGVKA